MPKKSIQWHCTTAEEWQSTGRTGREESDARELWCGYEWPTNHQKYTQTETESVCHRLGPGGGQTAHTLVLLMSVSRLCCVCLSCESVSSLGPALAALAQGQLEDMLALAYRADTAQHTMLSKVNYHHTRHCFITLLPLSMSALHWSLPVANRGTHLSRY